MSLLKLCGCGKIINQYLARCNRCEEKRKDRHKLYDKNVRDKEAAAFYNSKGWKFVREHAMQRDFGLCQRCYAKEDITLADMVDHIVPIKVQPELSLELDNTQSLCNSCHAKKTAEDRRKYPRA